VKNASGYSIGTMRATNVTGDSRSGVFTVTAFDKAGSTVGTLSGIVNDVAGGSTVTVTLIASDSLVGATRYEVQVDSSG